MLAVPILTLDAGPVPLSGAPETADSSGSRDDSVSMARGFAEIGFSRLHLADSAGARTADSGREEARELLRHTSLVVQAEVRDTNERTISDLLGLGARWIVTGLADLEDVTRLAEVASSLPARLIIDLEPRGFLRADSRRATRVFDLIAALESWDLAGLVVTAPNAGTTPTLTTLTRIEELVIASPWPVQVRCAPESLQSLRNLEDRGVACALFSASAGVDAIDPRAIAEEFAA